MLWNIYGNKVSIFSKVNALKVMFSQNFTHLFLYVNIRLII